MITQTINPQRSALNPLITPADIKPTYPDWEVIGAFNAGVAQYQDEIILLLRIAERPLQTDPNAVLVPVLNKDAHLGSDEPLMKTVRIDRQDPNYDFSDQRVIRDQSGNTVYLTSISHLRIARSRDGERFTIDEKPTILPEGELESWGIEDPRITLIDGHYYITYSAASEKGVGVGLISTQDFVTFERKGLLLVPTNKDVVLFPEKINGAYYMLHRPVPDDIGHPEMWIAESPDLIHWGNHRFFMGLGEGDARIGAGCVPIKTEQGWLILYHGADREHRYYMSAVLSDLNEPWRLTAALEEPFLIPEAEYEKQGFFRDVVFACGAIVNEDQVTMYYGAADDSMASCTVTLSSILQAMKPIA